MVSKFRLLSDENELQILKKSMVHFLPGSAQVLNILNLKIQKRFLCETKVDFYVYENQEGVNNLEILKSDTIEHPFVIVTQKPNIHSTYCILIEAPPNPTPEMMESFEKSIEWDRVTLYSAINQAFFDNHLKGLLSMHGVKTRSPDGMPCESYALDPEVGLKYEIDGFNNPAHKIEVKPLSLEDSEIIVNNYKLSLAHTKPEVERAIQNLTSVGVYINSELVSWALLTPVGLMNSLFTVEKYRGKGYGFMVLKALSKYVSELGVFPMAECELWNGSSRHVITRTGLVFNSYTNWIWVD